MFFDNLQSLSREAVRIGIVHTRSQILEACPTWRKNHYYSYGLRIAAINSKAAGALQNSYLYQGDFSEYDEDAGYNEFYLRHYDAQIGRWTTTDPYEEFANPYLGMGNNPGGMVDPDGGESIFRLFLNLPRREWLSFGDILSSASLVQSGLSLLNNINDKLSLDGFAGGHFGLQTWYVDKNSKVLLQTNDGSNDIVMVPDSKIKDVKYWAEHHNSVVDTKLFNDNYKAEFGLSNRQLTKNEVSQLSNLNSDWSRKKAVELFLNPSMSNSLAASSSEAFSQWTNPYLVVGGLGVAVGGLGAVNAAKGGSNVLLRTSTQLQAKFKHAGDFGVAGNYSKANAAKFSSAINQHINSPGIKVIQLTYHKQPAIHYLNPNTGLNIISTPRGQFWSGWKLRPAQLQNVLKHGGL